MKMMSRLLLLIGWTAAAATAAVGQTPAVPLKVRWSGTPPTNVVLELSGSDVPLSPMPNHFAGTIPPAAGSLAKVPLVARYGQLGVKLMLVVRRGTRFLDFELPYSAPGSCHHSFVSNAERPAQSRSDALRAMLIAHYLLQLPSPNDCSDDFRRRLLRARHERNVELTKNSDFFDIVPEYRQAYAESVVGQSEQLAQLARMDSEVRAVEVARIYRAQLAAQQEGDYEGAYAILAELEARAAADPGWQEAVRAQRVNLARDVLFLREASMASSVAEANREGTADNQ
jgi:hypothetical protein